MSQGISLGTKLGRKLQIRGESRDLKSTRLDSGRIDKRLISELGFGNERVFQTTFTESYSDAFLHISVDASGSMRGDKWRQTMISTIAICKAVDMIQNVDVMVSFRSTHDGNYRRSRDMTSPLILIAYDSRVDKFSKVKKMFPSIYPGGTTPEGLCFEAILKDIVPTTNNRESYFLNLSDGMPMFSNGEVAYYHEAAFAHTKKMVDEIRKQGIKVMSYFVSDSNYDRSDNLRDFRKMYGKDAEMIDLGSVLQISKTMNKKFLEKN
jgi:nitric oxide reductase activation protein